MVAGLVAAAVTAGVAAPGVHVAGVSFEVDGQMIPLVGFAQVTLLGAVIGGALLAVLDRRPGSARRRVRETAVALTAVSCVPSITRPGAAAKVALVTLHVLAAAVVVPALVRHAHD